MTLTTTFREQLAAYPRPDGARLTAQARCRAIIDFLEWLETQPWEDHFNLRTFVGWAGAPIAGVSLIDEAGHYLAAGGTTACALGWATWLFRDPDFRLYEAYDAPGPRIRNMDASYFGLSPQDLRYIFFAGEYGARDRRPAAIARRLRTVCARRRAVAAAAEAEASR